MERLLADVAGEGASLGMVHLDGTNVRAHQKAGGAQKKGISGSERDKREALGRSRGGFGTKVCAVCDGSGRLMGVALVQGQSHEVPSAEGLRGALPRVPQYVVCDRGCASEKFRDAVWEMGSRPVVPTERNEATLSCPARAYENRNCVERLFARLKEWRAFATRCGKAASAFAAVTAIAATWDRTKNSQH